MYPLSLVRTSIILSSTSSWFVTDLSNFYKYFFPFQSNFWWFFFSTPISFSFTFPSLLPIIFLFTSFPFPWCNLFDVVLFIASLRIRTSYCHFFRMRITILSPFPIWNWLKKNWCHFVQSRSKYFQAVISRCRLALASIEFYLTDNRAEFIGVFIDILLAVADNMVKENRDGFSNDSQGKVVLKNSLNAKSTNNNKKSINSSLDSSHIQPL